MPTEFPQRTTSCLHAQQGLLPVLYVSWSCWNKPSGLHVFAGAREKQKRDRGHRQLEMTPGLGACLQGSRRQQT